MAVKRKPKSKLEDKAQSRRFVETAKKLEVDEGRKSFDRVFEKLIKPGQSPRKKEL